VHDHATKKLLWWCNGIVRVASFIVPRGQRAQWLQEWRSEIWHWVAFLVGSARLNASSERQLLNHCWGAFADALWCRFNRATVIQFLQSYPATPSFCLLITGIVLVAIFTAGPVSLLRSSTPAIRDPHSLLTVSLNEDSRWLEPELLRDAAMDWTRNNRLVAGTATYAWRASVIRGPVGKQEVVSARVTPDMFEVLGTKMMVGAGFNSALPQDTRNPVVLSDAVWQEQFHRDVGAVGETLFLNGEAARVVGVLPAGFLFPGTDARVYTLFAEGPHPRLPGVEWPGVVIRLAPGLRIAQAEQQVRTLLNQTSFPVPAVLDVLSIKDIQHRSLESSVLVVTFAIFVLLILDWRTISPLCMVSRHRSLESLFRWWLFFALKSGSLIALAWMVAINLVEMAVHRFGILVLQYASGVTMWLFMVGFTIAIRWSIRDQASRCRTCLKRLGTAIVLGSSIGPLSQPSGFEFLCDSGHGLLHVPASDLSCLDSERWTDLDESWREVAQST